MDRCAAEDGEEVGGPLVVDVRGRLKRVRKMGAGARLKDGEEVGGLMGADVRGRLKSGGKHGGQV
jgi:hypothetical protein